MHGFQWLVKVIVGAEADSIYRVLGIAIGGHHQAGDVAIALLEQRHQVQTILLTKPDIKQRYIYRLTLNDFPGLRLGPGGYDLADDFLRLEQIDQRSNDVCIVVHDQQTHTPIRLRAAFGYIC